MIKTIATFPLTDELKDAEIVMPDYPVPVTLNYDKSKVLGYASVNIDGGEFIASISLYDGSVFPKQVAPGGLITSRRIEDGAITAFQLQEISFVP